MSSDAGDEIPRETSAAADQHGSGTALKASLAVLGLLFCFGVGLVGETYFREWRGKDAKPAQVTAQLPQTEEPRSPEITAKPASAPPAETKLAAAGRETAAAKPTATTAPSLHPPAAAGGEASAPATAMSAAAASHEMSSNASSAATASTLAALAPTASPAAAATAAAKPATAKTKPTIAAAHAASNASAAAASRLHYRVQFGAFAIEENAEILRRAIETPKLRISITRTADNSGRLLYHVRSPEFASYDEALNAVREAQDAAKQMQFAEAVEYFIQKVDESASEQARIQAAQSANH